MHVTHAVHFASPKMHPCPLSLSLNQSIWPSSADSWHLHHDHILGNDSGRRHLLTSVGSILIENGTEILTAREKKTGIARGESAAVKEIGHIDQGLTVITELLQGQDHHDMTTGDLAIDHDPAIEETMKRDLITATILQSRPMIDSIHLHHLCANQITHIKI